MFQIKPTPFFLLYKHVKEGKDWVKVHATVTVALKTLSSEGIHFDGQTSDLNCQRDALYFP